MKTDKCIRFDWVMKRMLRDKANFGCLKAFSLSFLRDKSLYSKYWRVKVTKLLLMTNSIVWTLKLRKKTEET